MRKKNIIFLLIALGCFFVAYQGMVFSPSFTMMFVVTGMVCCILGEILYWIQSAKISSYQKQIIRFCGRILYVVGIIWAFPAVIIYATGDDWMNGCMKAAGIISVLLCGIWIGWKWKKGEIGPAVCGKAVELLISLAAALLALFCGINSVALLPYGLGLLLLVMARLVEGKKEIREILFCVGMVLAAVFPVAPML